MEEDAIAEEKKIRSYIPIVRKVELVIQAELHVKTEQSISQNKFCEANGIVPRQLREWKKNFSKLKNTLNKTTRKKSLKVCSSGRPSRLEKLRNKIMPWISLLIREGKPIKIRRVAMEVKKWDRSFRLIQQNNDRVAPDCARKLIATTACKAWDNVPEEIVYNSWRRETFSYFPNEPTKPTAYVEEEWYSSDEEDANDDNNYDEAGGEDDREIAAENDGVDEVTAENEGADEIVGYDEALVPL